MNDMTQMQGLISVRVVRRLEEAVDICSFELVAINNESLPVFSAGSHVDVLGPTGQTRQYSLCNDENDPSRYVIAVLRDPASRGGSIALHDNLKEGDMLKISRPKNHFPLAHEARRSLLLGGGIGITPILCMAERLANTAADFEMHYCTRSRDRTAFMGRIEKSSFASRVHFHFDDGLPEQKLDIAATLAKPEPGVHIYACGPKGFMDAVLDTARKRGWPEEQLHYEFFSAEVLKSDDDESFDVQVASTRQLIRVTKDQTITEALTSVGIEIEMSCAQGVCGTCLTRVISGTPDHRDMFLSPPEQAANDQFLPCCSRSKSPILVLDL